VAFGAARVLRPRFALADLRDRGIEFRLIVLERTRSSINLKQIALARGVSPSAAIGALRSHSKVKMLSMLISKIIIEDTHHGEHLVK
jgi:hypothetical protein